MENRFDRIGDRDTLQVGTILERIIADGFHFTILAVVIGLAGDSDARAGVGVVVIVLMDDTALIRVVIIAIISVVEAVVETTVGEIIRVYDTNVGKIGPILSCSIHSSEERPWHIERGVAIGRCLKGVLIIDGGRCFIIAVNSGQRTVKSVSADIGNAIADVYRSQVITVTECIVLNSSDAVRDSHRCQLGAIGESRRANFLDAHGNVNAGQITTFAKSACPNVLDIDIVIDHGANVDLGWDGDATAVGVVIFVLEGNRRYLLIVLEHIVEIHVVLRVVMVVGAGTQGTRQACQQHDKILEG